jgi:hypothetical protein
MPLCITESIEVGICGTPYGDGRRDRKEEGEESKSDKQAREEVRKQEEV